MYIKKIIIKGFRNFIDNEVEFHEGIYWQSMIIFA